MNKETIKFWVSLLYKPALFIAGWTKNKIDDVAIPLLKSIVDRLLSTKK